MKYFIFGCSLLMITKRNGLRALKILGRPREVVRSTITP